MGWDTIALAYHEIIELLHQVNERRAREFGVRFVDHDHAVFRAKLSDFFYRRDRARGIVGRNNENYVVVVVVVVVRRADKNTQSVS